MDRKDAESIITKYMKPIYGFSLKRCSGMPDAEDLAQDICLKLFRALLMHDSIDDPQKFVWTVAHHALANYYRKKQYGAQVCSVGICVDEFWKSLPSDDDTISHIIKDEAEDRMQKEIAYLSKLQRQIVIAYYYENKKQEEIAQMLKIPLGTVKWHLFEAKKDLKKGFGTMRKSSELKFNPIKFTIMGFSGSIGSMGGTENFFRSSLSQNIAYCTLRRAKSINEIADCLGVSPVYVESEAEFLEEYGFLLKRGEKYIANLLIDDPSENVTGEILELQEEMYSKSAKIFANELFNELLADKTILSEACISSTWAADKNFILWTLIPYITALSGENLMDNSISFDEVATVRPDGGKNIAYAGFDIPDSPKQKYFDSMLKWYGPCWNANSSYTLWQVDSEWSAKRVNDGYQQTAIRAIELLQRHFSNEYLSPDEYAYLSELGYLKSFGNAVQIVQLKTVEAKNRLISIGDKIKETYYQDFERLKAPFAKLVLSHTPEHLKKMRSYGLQYIFHSDGWFLLYCMKELVKTGRLKLPTEEQKISLMTVIAPN